MPCVTIATTAGVAQEGCSREGDHAAGGLAAASGEGSQGKHQVNTPGTAPWGVPLTAALFCHPRDIIGNDTHCNVFILLD